MYRTGAAGLDYDFTVRAFDEVLARAGGGFDKARPEMVVFPRATEDVVEIVKITAKYKLPIVGRGAGTGLSGGAIALAGGVIIVTATSADEAPMRAAAVRGHAIWS